MFIILKAEKGFSKRGSTVCLVETEYSLENNKHYGMYIMHGKSYYPFKAHWQLYEAPAVTIRKPAFCARHVTLLLSYDSPNVHISFT
jgi:hypothetical protein